jgi:hypothetical protein
MDNVRPKHHNIDRDDSLRILLLLLLSTSVFDVKPLAASPIVID